MSETFTSSTAPQTTPQNLPVEPDSLVVLAGKIILRCAATDQSVADTITTLQKESGVGGWDELKDLTIAQVLSRLTVGEIFELIAYAEKARV